MFDKRSIGLVMGGALVAFTTSATFAGTIDFETADDFVTPLANGQDLETTAPFGRLFNLTTSGQNRGAAIFDSTPGLNSRDPDLWVDLGNLLILQSNDDGAKRSGQEIYANPNDSANGGVFNFDFTPAGEGLTLNTLDVVDVDRHGRMEINLFDQSNNGRTIIVPEHFTGDVAQGAVGWATINLLSGERQESRNQPNVFTHVFTDEDFDPNSIARMKVRLYGSGGIDNLNFTLVPVPAAVWLGAAGLGGVMGLRRRTLEKS